MNDAVDNELIERNITHNIDMKTNKSRETKAIKFFTKPELKIFMSAINDKDVEDLYATYFWLICNTGIRAGEALALTWDDLNFVSNELTISKTVKKLSSSDFIIGAPKTESSNRVINLDDMTIKKLKAWKSYQEKYVKDKGLGESKYIFVSRQNKKQPPHYRTVIKNFNVLLDELNLAHIGIHGLRHTHAVMLIEAGASVKYVAERLGHSNVEMTLNVYVHLTEKMKTDDMNKYVNHILSH